MAKKQVVILKVKSGSDPNKVAGAIAGSIREDGTAMIRTIGAGALNQAIKAIAIATVFLEAGGIQLCVRTGFVDLKVEGQERTGISLILEHRIPDPSHPIPDVMFVEKFEPRPTKGARHSRLFHRPRGDKPSTATG